MKIWIVFEEISDQYGTDKVSCVCSTKKIAERESNKIQKRRTFIKEIELKTN